MAKAFGCPTALLSTAERLRRVLSPTESLPRYDAGKIRELQSSERENWLSQPDGMRRPVSDGMLYAPKLSTRFEAQEIKETGNEKD
jgi:hypothetical protein